MFLNKTAFSICCFLYWGIFANSAFAAAQIDVIVFERLQSTPEALVEFGKNKSNVELPKNIMQWDKAVTEQKIQNVSTSADVNALVQRLNGQANYRVIWANSWKQNLSARRGSLTLLRSDENEVKGDKSIVESYLSLSKGAFPEVQAVILLEPESFRFADADANRAKPEDMDSLFSSTPENIDMESIEWKLRNAPQVEDNSVLVLSETRRMKLNTWYYLDHPVLGMMIRINNAR